MCKVYRVHYVEEVSRVAREAKLRLENLDEAGTVGVSFTC